MRDRCVHGRKDAPPHYGTKRGVGEVPEVSFDYAFVRRDDEEAVATLLVMRDRDTKSVRAWALERKGVDLAETVNRAVAGVQQLGYRGRVLIRTDGEGALKALRDAITEALPDGATPITTPVGESASNGIIEGAVKTVKGLLRVHLAALERKIGAKFPSEHPVLTWLVEHVSDIISKYMVGLDGKTGYERLFGRPVREEGLEFGELLHWHHRPTQDMNVVLDARWSTGVWLGRRWGGVVHQVFANGKVHEIRGIQRQPREARWRKEALEAITVTPWNRRPAAEGELRVLPPLAAPAAAGGAEEPEVRELEYNPHRVFIKQADLERFGFTQNCRRCILMRSERKAQGVKHGDECRLRVEQCLRDAGDPRVDRAERRALGELQRRAAGAAPPAAPPADGAAPGAPSATSFSAERRSNTASSICASVAVSMRVTCCLMIAILAALGALTAMPSARVAPAKCVSVPSNWAFTASKIAACAPMICTSGLTDLAATAMPAIKPPPPTGTTITSRSGRSSSISSATLPCPAATTGSSKGWINVSRSRAARSRVNCTESSNPSPC